MVHKGNKWGVILSTESKITKSLNSFRPNWGQAIAGLRSGLLSFLALFGISILPGIVLAGAVFASFESLEDVGLSGSFDWLYYLFVFTYFFASSSLGVTINFEISEPMYGIVSTDIFGAPTLVTVLLAWFFFKSARNLSKYQPRSIGDSFTHSLTRSLGLVLSLVLVTAAVGSATPGFAEVGSVAGLDLVDFAVSGGLVLLATFAGHLSARPRSNSQFASIRWSLLSIWYLILIALILLAFALIVLWIFNSINPDFGLAVRSVNQADVEVPGILSLIALLVALLFLPTMLFYVISFMFGASLGVSGTFGDLSEIISLLGISEFLGEQSVSLGPLSTIGIILAFFVALYAGAMAGFKTKIDAKHQTAPIVLFVFYLIFAALAVRLSNFGISSSNGIDVSMADQPAPVEVEAVVGILLPTILFVSLIATIGTYLGGMLFQDTLVSSSRAFTSVIINQNLTNRPVSFDGLIVGTMTGLLIFTSVAAPWTIATVNKAVSSLSGPTTFSETWLSLYKNDVAEALTRVSPRREMISNEVLEKAFDGDYSTEISSINSAGEAWFPGNLRAQTEITLTSDEGSFSIEMASDATLRDEFPLTYTSFSHVISPAQIKFEKVGAAVDSEDYPLEVNGESVDFDSYRLIPGRYEISIPENGMVAGVNETIFISSDETVTIEIGNDVLLTDQQKDEISSQLTAAETECLGESSDDQNLCADIDQLRSNTSLSPDAPAEFSVLEAFSDSQLSALNIDKERVDEEFSVNCSEPIIELTATSENLPSGLERNIDTAFGYTECSFELSYTDLYTDNVFDVEYELDYISRSSKEMLIVATAENGDIQIGELQVSD